MEMEIYKILKESLKASKKYISIVLIVLICIYCFSGFFSISQNEIGIHTRFGKFVDRAEPGIHFAFPFPVDKIHKIPIKTMKKIYVIDFSQEDKTRYSQLTGLASYCITGDNNIVNIKLGVQYSILAPEKYYFNNKNPDRLLYHIICNAIIKSLSTFTVDKVLTYGKRDIETFIKKETQKMINQIDLGLQVSFVELESIIPPKEVQQYFNDVINSKIDMEKMINKAESYKNENIPQAKGNANFIIQRAHSYQDKMVAQAEGDSARFLDVLKSYNHSQIITKKRLYLEHMNMIFQNLKNLYLVSTIGDQPAAQIKLFNSKNMISKGRQNYPYGEHQPVADG